MTEEEIQALQQGNISLKGEVETGKAELAARDTRIGEMETQNTELQTQVAEMGAVTESQNTEMAALKEGLTLKDTEIATLKTSIPAALSKYRSALAAANPGVPQELLKGDTIEEIEASLDGAKSIVEKVKAGIDAGKAGVKVPPGAPPRTPPDLSALSPREKIAYAVEKEAK